MKIIYFTDLHMIDKTPESRLDIYPEALFKKFKCFCDEIISHKPDYVICGGDWTDKPRTSVDLAGAFNKEIKRTQVPWYCVPGSHDTIGYNYESLKNTMLGYAIRSGVINLLLKKDNVIDENGIRIEGVPHFANMDASKENIPVHYAMDVCNSYNILVVHGMLVPPTLVATFPFVSCTNPNLDQIKKDAKDKKKSLVYCTTTDDVTNYVTNNKPNLILSGHYHGGFEVQQEDIIFLNPGSFGRNSICKRNVYYYLIDVKKHSNSFKHSFTKIPIKDANSYQVIFDFEKNQKKNQIGVTLQGYSKRLSQNIHNGKTIEDIIADVATEEKIPVDIREAAENEVKKASLLLQKNKNDLQFKGYKEEQKNIFIEQLTIENFQSYKNHTIYFTEGLNSIIGASHKGKTAILRALRWVFKDIPKGSGFIRNGQKKCSVEVVFNNGNKIKRFKTTNSTGGYIVTINNQEMEFVKIKEIPIEVLNACQIPEMIISKNYKIIPNIAMQHDPPFILGASGYDRATVLGHLMDIDPVDLAISEIRKSYINQNKDLKTKILDLDVVQNNLQEYKNLKQYKRKIKTFESILSNVKKNKQILSKLQTLYDKLLNMNYELKQLKTNIINFNNLNTCKENIESISHKIDVLETLSNRFASFESLILQKQYFNKILCGKNLNEAKKIQIDVDKNINKLEQTIELKNKLFALYENKKNEKDDYKNITDEIETLLQEYNNILGGLEECPICGNKIDLKHKKGDCL